MSAFFNLALAWLSILRRDPPTPGDDSLCRQANDDDPDAITINDGDGGRPASHKVFCRAFSIR